MRKNGRLKVAPYLSRFNFLSARGLGGAHALAVARARFTSRRLSVRILTTLFCDIRASAFLRGCGGTFFAKKVPPQNRAPLIPPL